MNYNITSRPYQSSTTFFFCFNVFVYFRFIKNFVLSVVKKLLSINNMEDLLNDLNFFCHSVSRNLQYKELSIFCQFLKKMKISQTYGVRRIKECQKHIVYTKFKQSPLICFGMDLKKYQKRVEICPLWSTARVIWSGFLQNYCCAT